MTNRFPKTSTTVVKISTLASTAIAQAGRAFEPSARPTCPNSVLFVRKAMLSGIPVCINVFTQTVEKKHVSFKYYKRGKMNTVLVSCVLVESESFRLSFNRSWKQLVRHESLSPLRAWHHSSVQKHEMDCINIFSNSFLCDWLVHPAQMFASPPLSPSSTPCYPMATPSKLFLNAAALNCKPSVLSEENLAMWLARASKWDKWRLESTTRARLERAPTTKTRALTGAQRLHKGMWLHYALC